MKNFYMCKQFQKKGSWINPFIYLILTEEEIDFLKNNINIELKKNKNIFWCQDW